MEVWDRRFRNLLLTSHSSWWGCGWVGGGLQIPLNEFVPIGVLSDGPTKPPPSAAAGGGGPGRVSPSF